MKITSLTLIRYKRLALNSINEFTINPKEQVQLILGTNGCGKSSVIKELTPLPPDQNDYWKDGSKTIFINNRNSNYVLKSTFSPTPKHSFIKDDVELNTGFTITTFKELVRQEFGITQEIHDLLTGTELFHQMSPARRREWFVKLSDVSYDYALKVYDELRIRSRDLVGAIKRNKNFLVTETSKLMSEVEEKKLRSEADIVIKELNILIEQSAPLDKPIPEYLNDYNIIEKTLIDTSNQLLRLKCVAPYGTHPFGEDPYGMQTLDDCGTTINSSVITISGIDKIIDNLKHNVTAINTLLNTKITDYTKLQDTLSVLTKTGELGIKSLDSKLVTLKESRELLFKKIRLGITVNEPKNVLSALDTVSDTLIDLFSIIQNNSERQYTQQKLIDLKTKYQITLDSKQTKLKLLSNLESAKLHQETHKTNNVVDCPKCNHRWSIGYDENKYNQILKDLDVLLENISGIDKDIKQVELDIEDFNLYGDRYRTYINCVRGWTILTSFWEYLTEHKYPSDAPKMVIISIGQFKEDLDILINIECLDNEINETLQLIEKAKEIGDANIVEVKNKLLSLEIEIANKTDTLSQTQIKILEYDKYKKQLNTAEELRTRLENLISDIENVNLETVEMMRRDTLNLCVKQLQQSLALKETALSTVNVQKGIVKDLSNNLEKMIKESSVIDLLMKNLSPTTGLIADGLLGFIKTVINQMNSIINNIWIYPLIIKDCSVSSLENSDLDYKFPMIVGSKTNIVSDIKLGSKGIKEIIDLSFKISSMKYLGLSEYPLYLDEFSANFDKTHKTSATSAIKALLSVSHFSQMFLVSHDYAEYGIFNNKEVCVLDKTNITVPVNYNEHVIIN